MIVDLIIAYSKGGPEGHWDTLPGISIPNHLAGNSDAVAEWYCDQHDEIEDCVFIGVMNWNPIE